MSSGSVSVLHDPKERIPQVGETIGFNGKENGNYWDYRGSIIRTIGYVLGLCWFNGKENGNYHNRVIQV